jgi:putative tricarboxylic transport membrane protein
MSHAAAAAGVPNPAAEPHPAPSRVPDFLLCAGLAVAGVIVLIDALRLSNNVTGVDPLGPKPLPVIVGGALILLAGLLALEVARGNLGEAEAGEDIDLHAKADLKTVLMLVGVFAANIVLIDLLGWVISGSLLFYGLVIVLGSRHFIRDLVISVALALVTFYGFAIGLGVPLPAGILQGIL